MLLLPRDDEDVDVIDIILSDIKGFFFP